MLSVFLSGVFYCCHPLSERQRVTAISIAVQRRVGTAVQNTQGKKPEGHREKILLTSPLPFFLILNVSQNVAELKQTGITCDSPPQEGSCYSIDRAVQRYTAQSRRYSELQTGSTHTVKTFGPYRGATPLQCEDD